MRITKSLLFSLALLVPTCALADEPDGDASIPETLGALSDVGASQLNPEGEDDIVYPAEGDQDDAPVFALDDDDSMRQAGIQPADDGASVMIIEDNGDGAQAASLPDPLYTIENISVFGNSITSTERVLNTMGLHSGDRIQLKTLESARLRLTSGGNVETADLELLPGSEQGKINIHIEITERLPLQFNDYYLGRSDKSDFWAGLNVSYLNVFGTGQRFDTVFVASTADEYAWRAVYTIPKIGGSPLFLAVGLHSINSTEGVFLRPDTMHLLPPDGSAGISPHDSLRIHRHGFIVSTGLNPLPPFGIRLSVHSCFVRRIDRDVQESKHHALDDYLLPGRSVNTAVSAVFTFDTRNSLRMPSLGHFVGLHLSGTGKSGASDYKYFKAFFFHQSNFSLKHEHILRIMTSAGAVVGDAPYYEKFRFADFYHFTPTQIAGFAPSSAAPFDLFKTGSSDLGYEDFIASLNVEYAWQHRLNKANIRTLEVYARIGAAYADSLDTPTLMLGTEPDKRNRSSFPCDLSGDIGIRMATDFGAFRVSIGQVLNLIPR